MLMFWKEIFLVGLIATVLTSAAPAEDEIHHLPGLNSIINFKHYSGYLDGIEGDHLHYWYVESQGNPSEDPVVLWLNGGPGCSSLDGLLNELGPYLMAEDGETLNTNPHSWNKIANVLFIEAPVCVGFSYSDSGKCDTDDDRTSLSNYLALLDFYKKFPEFRRNELFITGESYGGIYIPTLTVRVVQGMDKNPLNLQGYAIGNGLTSYELNDDSIIFFAYYHGLIGKTMWHKLVKSCCTGSIPSRHTCQFSNPSNRYCRKYVDSVQDLLFNQDLNMYNLYAKCLHPATNGTSRYHFDRDNLFSTIKSASLKKNLGLDPPCTDSTAMRAYLNSAAVKKAIHIPEGLPLWEVCSVFNYQKVYTTMKPQYLFLAKHTKGLVYNGDVDMACNFLGDEWFIDDLGLKVTSPRRIWRQGGQVAGFVKRFENLDLVTIRGSGHMVPQDKPGPAFKMIKSFILGRDY